MKNATSFTGIVIIITCGTGCGSHEWCHSWGVKITTQNKWYQLIKQGTLLLLHEHNHKLCTYEMTYKI